MPSFVKICIDMKTNSFSCGTVPRRSRGVVPLTWESEVVRAGHLRQEASESAGGRARIFLKRLEVQFILGSRSQSYVCKEFCTVGPWRQAGWVGRASP